MLLQLADYYDIIDISDGTKKPLAVIAETYDRGEAEVIAYKHSMGSCEVYWETESNGKRYRVICPKTTMTSDAKDAL